MNTISVKNVGEAKSVLKKNSIKVTSSRYIKDEEGIVSISSSDFSKASMILKSFGLFKF